MKTYKCFTMKSHALTVLRNGRKKPMLGTIILIVTTENPEMDNNSKQPRTFQTSKVNPHSTTEGSHFSPWNNSPSDLSFITTHSCFIA